METIKEYLVKEHKLCDEELALLEKNIHSNHILEAKEAFGKFYKNTDKHFRIEEELLFLEFENITQNTMGPTNVMRMEHQNIRLQLEEIKSILEKDTLDKRDLEAIKNIIENLFINLQQHNLKEEQILYNMFENVFNNDLKKELLLKIKNFQ